MGRTRWELRNRALHSVPTQRQVPAQRHRSLRQEASAAGSRGGHAPYDVPGPTTRARQVVAPDEPVLWAASGDRVAHDVPGLDQRGRPQASVELGGFDRDPGTMTTNLDLERRPPDVVVFGDHPDCLARRALRHVCAHGGQWRTWALTSARLLVLDVLKVPLPRDGSLLRRTLGLGRELVNIVTERARRHVGDGTELPVTCPPMAVVAAVDRSRIGDIAVSRRRLAMRTRPCLRVRLVDGSGLDLLFGVEDESVFEWMLQLGRGESEGEGWRSR
ncbi:hypothetical protein [Saccharomonospora sp. NB11]|uniref:hypothetical protein n=1 Tax=Saccharomonospora sp. NB11 TaxID=1642298 RepID=UPI0018D0ED8C|nr:hypothetical protein [Saccharomonospora sp. NB11]